MNIEDVREVLSEFTEVALLVLLGITFAIYITSFPNPVSNQIYAWKFTTNGHPIESGQEFVNQMNSDYRNIQEQQSQEFGYCANIENRRIQDFEEIIYQADNRSNARLGRFDCPEGEWNSYIHSHPIACQPSNNDLVIFGIYSNMRYMGLICDPGKMFFIDKRDDILTTRHPVENVDFKLK